MRIVLTKPAEYPDFILGPGVVLDLSEQEAEQMVAAKAATRFSGVPGAATERKRKPKKAPRSR